MFFFFLHLSRLHQFRMHSRSCHSLYHRFDELVVSILFDCLALISIDQVHHYIPEDIFSTHIFMSKFSTSNMTCSFSCFIIQSTSYWFYLNILHAEMTTLSLLKRRASTSSALQECDNDHRVHARKKIEGHVCPEFFARERVLPCLLIACRI